MGLRRLPVERQGVVEFRDCTIVLTLSVGCLPKQNVNFRSIGVAPEQTIENLLSLGDLLFMDKTGSKRKQQSWIVGMAHLGLLKIRQRLGKVPMLELSETKQCYCSLILRVSSRRMLQSLDGLWKS